MLTRDDYAGADENIVPHVYRDAVFVSPNNRLGRYVRFTEWTLHGVVPHTDPVRTGQVADPVATEEPDKGSTTELLLRIADFRLQKSRSLPLTPFRTCTRTSPEP